MRIAISANSADENGRISRHAARAECYLVFDEMAKLQDVVQNPFKDYDHAVGIRVADYLHEKGIGAIAAANFGTGFIDALDAKGVRHVECDGIVAEVAKDLVARFGRS